MRACELHKRAVVVFESGLGDCPLCAAADKLESAEAELDDLRGTVKHMEDEAEAHAADARKES